MNEVTDQQDIVAPIGMIWAVSLLFGVTVASLLPLLLNVPRLEYVAAVLLFPGGLLGSLMDPSRLVPHPLLLIAANVVFYAMCLFGLSLALRRWLRPRTVRLGALILGSLAIVLFATACIPRFNPLWPHGMVQLKAQEVKLKELIHSDMTIDQVRAALEHESIPVNEDTEDSTREVLRNRDIRIVTSAGDRLIFSRFRTDAVQYPCDYDLQVVVLFAPDGKIKNRYIAPLPICP